MKFTRPSPAMVVACVALFAGLGGTGMAASRMIDGGTIKPGSITAKQIRNGAISAAKLAPGVAVSGPQGLQGVQGVQGVQGLAGPTGAAGVAGAAGQAGSSGLLAGLSAGNDPVITTDGSFQGIARVIFTAEAGKRYSIGYDGVYNFCNLAGNPSGPSIRFLVNGNVVDYPNTMFMSFPAGQQVEVVAQGAIQCDNVASFGLGPNATLSVQAFAMPQ